MISEERRLRLFVSLAFPPSGTRSGRRRGMKGKVDKEHIYQSEQFGG